ncbi:uncharacterized protein LOC127749978 [Frankliniella occidentalis]|uniref:Uncharacterized protein LOC127749978 n=1 Tax=Frankliniella occidentalis TaxID=133901 RepID=A0A9C6UAD3_FRAOC|nr:uncharacterized protein LOC127749978 [Frankliniella occidentalis]
MANQDSGANAQDLYQPGERSIQDLQSFRIAADCIVIPSDSSDSSEAGDVIEVEMSAERLFSDDELPMSDTTVPPDAQERPADIYETDVTESVDGAVGLQDTQLSRPRIAVKDMFRLSAFGPQSALLRALPSDHSPLDKDASRIPDPDTVPLVIKKVASNLAGWCAKCTQRFPKWSEYIIHCKSAHNQRNSSVCKHCSNFISDKDFEGHERKYHAYPCSVISCPARFCKTKHAAGHSDYHRDPALSKSSQKVTPVNKSKKSTRLQASLSATATSSRPSSGISKSSAIAGACRKSTRLASCSTSATVVTEDPPHNYLPSFSSSARGPLNPLSFRSLLTESSSIPSTSSETIPGSVTELLSQNTRYKVLGFCWVCKQPFPMWEDFCTHYSLKHGDGDSSVVRCQLCLAVSTAKHTEDHEDAGNKHKCQHCSATFLTLVKLVTHRKFYHRLFD